MGEGAPTYGEELRAAITAAGTSRRAFSYTLAEQKGTEQASEYRALGKYLSDEALPEPEQAARIAVGLGAPRLALVTEPGKRRRARRTALEERVVHLETALNELGPDLQRLADRVAALERQAPPRKKPAANPKASVG